MSQKTTDIHEVPDNHKGNLSPDPKRPFSIIETFARYSPLLLLSIPLFYLVTMAQSLVLGDPTEYTFVANILGIAHPPGYAFITLLGKAIQTFLPFGEIPWRMHLLSGISATAAAFFVYGTIVTISRQNGRFSKIFPYLGRLVAVLAALIVATAANFWQHAIHANPHIITAAFLAANLFFLTKWWSINSSGDDLPDKTVSRDRWLYLFSFSAGLGITHHPLTVFSFLAYGLFILWIRPHIWREWRTLVKMLASAMLGLSLWLYYPLRSATEPAFGPHNMNTVDGFLDHILARGISEGLPFFGLADIWDRATVFWSLLRLQYTLPVVFMAAVGLLWLLAGTRLSKGMGENAPATDDESREKRHRNSVLTTRPLGFLYGLALLSNYLFVINLRQQDIMAYLLGVFLLIGLLSGVGLLGLLDLLDRRRIIEARTAILLIGALFLLGPIIQIVRNSNRVSLRDYTQGSDYVASVFDWFDGEGEEAILLNDWEHMTPLWYTRYVEEAIPDPADITAEFVSTRMPWLESVYYYLPGHPVYLSGYRPEIAGAGFRLRPRGPFYQVVQPGDTSIPPELTLIEPAAGEALEIVAFGLPERHVRAGDYVPLVLAMRTVTGTEDYYVPVVFLGEGDDRITYEFTTDGHLITPMWQPGETIIERFDLALPLDLPEGDYPITVGLRNLSTRNDTDLAFSLGQLAVSGQSDAIDSDRPLANFRQRVGLVSANARQGLGQRRSAPWQEPIRVSAGETINVTLEWASLAPAEESYTVFLHLIDLANQPIIALDYTPLGGSFPTHLWIPKWLPGQQVKDPYRVTIPEDLPPGTYLIEAGLYEMTGGRRLLMSDAGGNLVGDRYILGAVEVTPAAEE